MGEFDNEKQQQLQKLNETIQVTRQKSGDDAGPISAPVQYDTLFAGEILSSQESFYKRYKEEHHADYAGRRKVTPRKVPDVQIRLQDRNFGYFGRKQRVAEATDYAQSWSRKLEYEEGQTEFGLAFDPGHATKDTLDLMKGTLATARILERKKSIAERLEEGADKSSETYKQYLECKDTILALSPQIRVIDSDDLTQDVQYDEESVRAFQYYIEQAIKDPIKTIKDAASDAAHSYGDIPLRIFEKEGVTQSFPQLKQLRDKYKALSNLIEKKNLPPALKKLSNQIADAEKTEGTQNYSFATMLYSSIDADLRYALNNNGIGFDDDGSLVDTEEERNHAYKTDGALTSSVMEAVRKNRHKVPRESLQIYWDQRLGDMLSSKEERKFSDDYSIVKTVDKLESSDQKKSEDVKQISQDAKKTASMIYDIDKDLAKAQEMLSNNSPEIEGRPELKNKLVDYINRRRQQQIDLLDRANGCINVLNHLIHKTDLSPLGDYILTQMRLKIANEEEIRKRDYDDLMSEEDDDIIFEGLPEQEAKKKDILAKYPFEKFKKQLETTYKECREVSGLVANYDFAGYDVETEEKFYSKMVFLERRLRGINELTKMRVGEKGNYWSAYKKSLSEEEKKQNEVIHKEIILRGKIVLDRLKEYRLINKDPAQRESVDELRKMVLRKNLIMHQKELRRYLKGKAKAEEEKSKAKQSKAEHSETKTEPVKVQKEEEQSKKTVSSKGTSDQHYELDAIDYKKTLMAPEKGTHVEYEPQGSKNYCWACVMSGLINAHAGKKVSDLKTIQAKPLQIPEQKDSGIDKKKTYDDAKALIDGMYDGTRYGNPAIFGDYIFQKVPDTAVRTAIVSRDKDRLEYCKRRFLETLSTSLEKGPVGLLRDGHFVLVCGLDKDTIKVRDSREKNPDSIIDYPQTVSQLFSKGGEQLELCWLEDVKGREKEIADRFDFKYDPKTGEFSKKQGNPKDATKPGEKSFIEKKNEQTILHRDGIEEMTQLYDDVVFDAIYLPKKVSVGTGQTGAKEGKD